MTSTPYPLGRNVNHDPRSWAYRVAPAASRTTVRWERLVPVLDQGELGSCTGNAGTGCLGTAPNAAALTGPGLTGLDESYAVKLYSDATMVDSDPAHYPPTDTGSDGLSVAKVLKARGLVSGYLHAFGIDDAFSAIQHGPLMVGTVWTQDMFSPDADGFVSPTGATAGGHEYECVGYDASADAWEFVNSWGTSWGKAGRFHMTTAVFDHLLRQQGDVVLLVPSTQPVPTPTGALAADLTMLDAWAAARHSGSTARAAAAWRRVRPFVR